MKSGFIWQKVHREADGSSCSVPDGGNMEQSHVPHIDMQNRDFVLKPMDEIAPYYRHPVLNKTIHQLLDELSAR